VTFNPLAEKGIPLGSQIRNWRELNTEPIDPEPPDPYTRCRIIAIYEMIEHRKAEKIVDQLTEVMPGRPTVAEHRYPADNVRPGTTAPPRARCPSCTR
jgi:hypothetical protein